MTDRRIFKGKTVRFIKM